MVCIIKLMLLFLFYFGQQQKPILCVVSYLVWTMCICYSINIRNDVGKPVMVGMEDRVDRDNLYVENVCGIGMYVESLKPLYYLPKRPKGFHIIQYFKYSKIFFCLLVEILVIALDTCMHAGVICFIHFFPIILMLCLWSCNFFIPIGIWSLSIFTTHLPSSLHRSNIIRTWYMIHFICSIKRVIVYYGLISYIRRIFIYIIFSSIRYGTTYRLYTIHHLEWNQLYGHHCILNESYNTQKNIRNTIHDGWCWMLALLIYSTMANIIYGSS